MADSPIRDGGDQPLDDEPELPGGDLSTVPEHRPGAHPPEDDRELPAGGEPPLPYPNADRDGQADFAADATGERYERVVDEGLERIDEHRARIEQLEAEQPGNAVGASGSSLEPGPGAPPVPGGPVGSGEPGVPEPDPGAPDPTAPGAPQAPQGPGTLDPTAPVGDPAGDASALDDVDRAQP
ncbi:hypothetical protein [Agrococcus sp. HG114]|uniref:hypothetical protein n=1 Tax=Agrococcus sp. HG114 TaxID=2969757 RepID=UPI00215B2844|nr:hypothetical protein [Agrococcus sp. HG114]MCR8671536.1 hypothetical protein [Agrococcus sp. HG114]